jgi:hypothetical protein
LEWNGDILLADPQEAPRRNEGVDLAILVDNVAFPTGLVVGCRQTALMVIVMAPGERQDLTAFTEQRA